MDGFAIPAILGDGQPVGLTDGWFGMEPDGKYR